MKLYQNPIYNCQKCELSKKRKNVVLTKIKKRDILFISEAPNQIEDTIGEPGVGEEGKFLIDLLDSTNINNYYLTYTVLCWPQRPPLKKEIAQCYFNIQKIITKVNPNVIIFIGDIAESTFKNKTDRIEFSISKPESIINMGGVGTFLYRETINRLKKAKRVNDEIKSF